MKKILLSLVVVLIILFCGAWFFASYMINSQFEKTLKENNIPVSYKSFKVGGFPFNFNITLSNPEYLYNDGVNKIAIKIDGECELKAGLFAEKITLSTNGPVSLYGHVSGYKLKMKASAKDGTYYTVNLQSSPLSSSFLSNITKVSSEPRMLFKVIDYVQLSGDGLQVKDLLSNSNILSIGEYDLKLSLGESGKEKYKIVFKEKLKDARFTQKFQSLANFFSDNISGVRNSLDKVDMKVRKYFSVFNLAERGVINHDVSLKYTGDLGNKGKIDISKIKLNDDLGKANLGGELSFDVSKTTKVSSDLKGNVLFSKEWYSVAENSGKNLLSLLPKFSVGNSTLEKILNSLGKASRSSNGYIPKLNEFGNIKLAVKMDYKNRNKTDYVDIKNTSIKTDIYSAAIKGKYLVKNHREKYDFDLSVENYQTLIDDILALASAVGNSNNVISFASGGNFQLSKSVGDKIKAFVVKVSNDPSNQTTLDISAKKTMEEKYPAVGSYNSQQFGSMWSSFKTELVIGEVSRNIKKLIPKNKGDKVKNLLDGKLGKLGGILAGITG